MGTVDLLLRNNNFVDCLFARFDTKCSVDW